MKRDDIVEGALFQDGTTIPFGPAETFFTRVLDECIDQELDGAKGGVDVSRKAFKYLIRSNLIDYIPDGKGRISFPVVRGVRVYVPNSVYSRDYVQPK